MNTDTAPKNPTLHEITTELLASLWAVDETTEPDEQLEIHLDLVEALFEDKVDRVLYVADDFRAKAEAYKKRAAMLAAKARTMGNTADRLVEYVRKSMEFAGKDKLETTNYPAISIRKTPARVELDILDFLAWVTDNERDDLLRYKDPEPNKTAIKAALKAGGEIPGAALVTGTRLSY